MSLRHCHLSLVKRMLFGLSGFHNRGSSKNGYGPRILTSWATVSATGDVLEREDTRHMYVPNCARRPSTGKLKRCRAQNKGWLLHADVFAGGKKRWIRYRYQKRPSRSSSAGGRPRFCSR